MPAVGVRPEDAKQCVECWCDPVNPADLSSFAATEVVDGAPPDLLIRDCLVLAVHPGNLAGSCLVLQMLLATMHVAKLGGTSTIVVVGVLHWSCCFAGWGTGYIGGGGVQSTDTENH